MSSPDEPRCRAHAKINLVLRVLGRRSDGYHDLWTVFHELEFHDDVELRPEPAAEGVELEIDRATASGMAVAGGEDNLVVRAARAFFARIGRPPRARLRLVKRIPAGAGLGGGSSDAAATLRLLNAHHGRPLDAGTLHELACELGSDVPFFLRGGTQIGEGRGERLRPAPESPNLHFVLIVPPFGVSTPAVYKNHRPRLTHGKGTSSIWPVKILADKGLAFVAGLENDLEETAMRLCPELAELRDRIVGLGFRGVRMSGSGSTLFLAFADSASADRAHRAMASLRGAGVELLRTRSAIREVASS